MRVTGVDGCRGSWLAVTLDDRTGSCSWRLEARFATLMAADTEAIGVDIPIGLPEAGRRACDVAARAELGRRGVSVFAAPVRPVLGCGTYAEARALLASRGGPSMSAQAFGIVAAVRDVDSAVGPGDEDRVVEAHPELAFSLMGGGPGLPRKRSATGAAQRLRLLAAHLPGGIDVLEAVATAPEGVPLDDALDALACAWVAGRWSRGEARVLGDGVRDSRGLVMRIVA